MYLSVLKPSLWLLCRVILASVCVLPTTLYAESGKDIKFTMPKDMVTFEGRCEKFNLAGRDKQDSCKGMLSYTSFENGRAVYTVFRKDGKSFTFSGGKEVKKKDYIYRLVIDRVYEMESGDKLGMKKQKIPVSGLCELDSIDNPKPTITCKAAKDDGDEFELVFKVKNSTLKTLSKLPGPEKTRKINATCTYVSQIGLYYQAAQQRSRSYRGQIQYLMHKMQQIKKVDDPRQLENYIRVYMTLLQKIDYFQPDTRAAYVYGACVWISSLQKTIPDDAGSVQKINTLLRDCEKVSINRKVLNDCVGPKLPGIIMKDYLKKPKVLNPEKHKKIIAHCGYMSQIGKHYNDVNEMALIGQEKMAYMIGKMQENDEVDDVKKLEKNVMVYMSLLQKIDNFGPAINTAYVRGACKLIHAQKITIPDDAELVQEINGMLKKCKKESPSKDELLTCVDKKLAAIVIKKHLGL